MAELWVPGRPKPKERPRRGRNNTMYTPRPTLDAQRRIAEAWREANLPVFEGPTGVSLRFLPEGTLIIVEPMEDVEKILLRADIDNLSKLVLDGLNKVAWADDAKVVGLHVEKL